MQIAKEDLEKMLQSKMDLMSKKHGTEAYFLMTDILLLKEKLQEQKNTRFIALPDWNLHYERPTVSAMRNYITKRFENGFEDFKVAEKDGERWYINEAAYLAWRQWKFEQSRKRREQGQ